MPFQNICPCGFNRTVRLPWFTPPIRNPFGARSLPPNERAAVAVFRIAPMGLELLFDLQPRTALRLSSTPAWAILLRSLREAFDQFIPGLTRIASHLLRMTS